MLLLTVTSLAISCFSVKASAFKTPSESKKTLSTSNPKALTESENSAEEIFKLRKQAVLDASVKHGAFAGIVVLSLVKCAGAYLVNNGVKTESPFLLDCVVLAAVTATLSFAQDYYFVSEKDKATTTSFERVKKMVTGTAVPIVMQVSCVYLPHKIYNHYKSDDDSDDSGESDESDEGDESDESNDNT